MRLSDIRYHRIYQYKSLKELKGLKRRFVNRRDVAKRHLRAVNQALYLREEKGKPPSLLPLSFHETKNRWWERDRQKGRVFWLKLRMLFWTPHVLAGKPTADLQRRRILVREVLAYDFLSEKEKNRLWTMHERVVRVLKLRKTKEG